MANTKSKAKRKADVAARSAHVQKQAAGGTAKAPTTSKTAPKTTATRKATAAPAPEPTGLGKVRAVATRSTSTSKSSTGSKPTAGKLIPKSGKLKPGQKAPQFTAIAENGERYALSQALSAKAKKGAVIFFYPKAGSPGCTAEACDFRDSVAPLEAAGYTVIGISPDDPNSLTQFAAKQRLPYKLLSDPQHKVAQKYGVWHEDEPGIGVKVAGRVLGTKGKFERSTFVVDPKGKLVYAKYGVRAKGHVARLKEALGI